VWCDANGSLFAVDPPIPPWSDTDTDTGDYDLANLGTWVQMTGLVTTIGADVTAGDRLNVTANISVVNLSGSRAGSIDIGFGIDAAQPSTGINISVTEGMASFIPISLSTTAHGGLTTGQTITIWGRRSTEEQAAFEPVLQGSTTTHELTIGIPA